MPEIIRWSPARTTLSDAVERLLENDFFGPVMPAYGVAVDELALDMVETANAYVVKATLAGVKPEDLDVHIEDGELVIRGEVKREEKAEEGKYLWSERYYGEFERRVCLPSEVDADKVAANLKDGVLTVEVPKAEAAKPKKVTVNVA